jgi:hypothetical protein
MGYFGDGVQCRLFQYQLSEVKLTWYEALQRANLLGKQFALSLNETNDEEMVVILKEESFKRNETINNAWLCASDIKQEEVWVDQFGSEITHQPWGSNANNSGTDKNCAAIYVPIDGKWGHSSCTDEKRYAFFEKSECTADSSDYTCLISRNLVQKG